MSLSLWKAIARRISPAMAAADTDTAPPAIHRAAKAVAALVVVSHRSGETAADADCGASAAASAGPESATPRRNKPRRSFSRAPCRKPAAERAGGPAQPIRRVVEGKALEVTEHDGLSEGVW